MALINTLRNKMGKFLVAIIGFSIVAFVLADFLQNGSLFTDSQNNIGSIAGNEISLKEFQEAVQEKENSFIMNFDRQPTEQDKLLLRNQAWEDLINVYAFQKELDNLGIRVTKEEIWDMLQGKNVDQNIKQSFTNDETGEFDREMVLDYLQKLPSLQPVARLRWEIFKKGLISQRKKQKYENLFLKSFHITEAEAEAEYHLQNDVADIEYVFISYQSIPDSTVNVNDDEIKKYYEENKERYKIEENRSLKYVVFDQIASSADTNFVKDELELLKEEFYTTMEDSIFASIHSDESTFYNKYNVSDIPLRLKNIQDSLSLGQVYGPYFEDNAFKLYKVVDFFQDEENGVARASHILFKGEDDETKRNAQNILNELKNGANFSKLAKQYGTDGTANKGGDLGWFGKGKMVEEFENAVFNASKTGLINNLIKTKFGYHIIKVDEIYNSANYKVASISRQILPSDETINIAYSKADVFVSSVNDLKTFEERAKQDSLTVHTGNKLQPDDARVGALTKARVIVRWLFNNASTGDVSQVFDLGDKYVIAVMTEINEKGYKDLVSVKEQISAKLIKTVKANSIKSKLDLSITSLQEMANSYGNNAEYQTKNGLKLDDKSLPSVGYDPSVVGYVFSLANDQVGKPYEGENGVIVVKMNNKVIASEIADYSKYKSDIENDLLNRITGNVQNAIKDNANIEDKRYNFY